MPASADLVLAAFALSEQRRISDWDALIAQAALQANCRTLYSEDFQTGAQFGNFVVMNPFLPQVQEPMDNAPERQGPTAPR